MATASVARDIVEIFERHGEWREKEALRLLSKDGGITTEERQAIVERTKHQPDNEKVQYWGFSYGSILGATLSALFPDHIRRAVLDGVCDSPDYMAGGWTTNLQDTDLVLARLAEYCWDGGADKCAIWHEDGPAVIIENVQRTISNLRTAPISVAGGSTSGPAAVTYNDLRRLFREIVYWPLSDFPMTARILHDLSKRNGTSLAAWTHDQRPDIGKPLSEQCLKDGPYSPSCFPNGNADGASSGIACSDGPGDRLTQSKEDYMHYANSLIAQSSLIGASWAEIQIPCTAWQAHAHWRYEGDFRNKIAHPILFAGNTIDPVTPLRNAFTMAKGFEGAGVLHQDSEGHCTYSGLSMCSMKAIRRYFQTGELPGKKAGLRELDGWDGVGMLCETDRKPFDGYERNGNVPELPEGETDEALWDALVGLNRVWP